jgi:hypothetical protein
MVLFVVSQQNLLQMMILRLDFCVAWGKSDGWMQDCRYCSSIRAILLFRLADELMSQSRSTIMYSPSFRFASQLLRGIESITMADDHNNTSTVYISDLHLTALPY